MEGRQRHPPDRDAGLKELLTEAEIWNVSLLLANADKPLPPPAVEILRGEPAAAPAADLPETK